MKKIVSMMLLFSFASHFAIASDWSKYRHQKMTHSSPHRNPHVDPVYQDVFNHVDRANLIQTLQQLSGSLPVNVGGSTYSITDRYSPAMKVKFRAFWQQYFTNLGIQNQEFSYATQHSIGESQGHNLEAVLPGKSKDSIVIIVHYDSIGPSGQESTNPGVDDDTSGMATMLETARVLNLYRDHLKHTVRFVAADYEEHPFPGLEGAREYAKYIQNLSNQQGFKIIAAIDNEQSGWNCLKEGGCSDGASAPSVDLFSCSGDSGNFNSAALGDLFVDTSSNYSKLQLSRGCMGENSDHYALWEIGTPAVVFSEHSPFDNPHFDQNGGDTFDHIDQDYFFQLAQVGVTFAARVAVLE